MRTRQVLQRDSARSSVVRKLAVPSKTHTGQAGPGPNRQGHGDGSLPAFSFNGVAILAPMEGNHAKGNTTLTRAPDRAIGEEDVTANGGGVPAAGPASASPIAPTPTAVTPHCVVASGPTYTPRGTIPATTSGGVKRFPFRLAATFSNRSPEAVLPSCCSVRQYIKWDQRYVDSKGGPPHSGFPSSTPVDTWIEDRDANDKRYGHRAGPYSDPIAGGGDEYTTRGVRDQAGGDTYSGRDTPQAPVSRTGKWQFRLNVIDECNSNAVKASSSVITVNYG
jgi:hypothetical protein